MKVEDVLKVYGPRHGSRIRLAKALHISPAAVSQWKDKVPKRSAQMLADLHPGVLVFNPADYQDGAA